MAASRNWAPSGCFPKLSSKWLLPKIGGPVCGVLHETPTTWALYGVPGLVTGVPGLVGLQDLLHLVARSHSQNSLELDLLGPTRGLQVHGSFQKSGHLTWTQNSNIPHIKHPQHRTPKFWKLPHQQYLPWGLE